MQYKKTSAMTSATCQPQWLSRLQFDPCWVSNILCDHEIFHMVILSLPLIQEGQLSVPGERMCTILLNCLELSLLSKSVVRLPDHT